MIAQGQITISDLNDITTGSSAPTSPVVNQLWCDTGVTPNQLKKWNGSAWEVVNYTDDKAAYSLVEMSGNKSKWLYRRYDSVQAYPYRSNVEHLVPSHKSLIPDFSAFLPNLDFYMGWLQTYIYCPSAYIFTRNIMHDDGAVIYVNDAIGYEYGGYRPNVTITLNFTAGWNKLDILWQEGAGGDGIDFRGKLTDIAEISKMNCISVDVAADILTAQTAADAANAVIAKIADDDVLTPSEKQQALREWLVAVSEKPLNVTQASSLGVDSSAYVGAYDALASFIGTNLNDVTTTWTMGVGNGSLFRNRFSSYYTARTNLLNAISTKVNTSATNAHTKIDGLQVGGRNLVKDSLINQSVNSDFGFLRTSNTTLKVGNQYTICVDASTSLLGQGNGFMAGYRPLYNEYEAFIIFDSTSVKRYVKTFVATHARELNTWVNLNSGNVFVERFSVVEGNVAMLSWEEAPEDVQARIDAANAKITATDYLKEAFKNDNFKPDGTSTSILWSKLMLMRDSIAPYKVTGGMSGLSSDPVGMWTGGTYEGAQQSATNPETVAGIDRKDGSGHRAFGKMLWDKLGNLSAGGFQITNGFIKGFEGLYERVRLTSNAITPLNELTDSWVRDTADFNIQNFYSGTVYNFMDEYGSTQYNDSTSARKTSIITLPVATSIKLFSGALGYQFDSLNVQASGANEVFKIYGVGNYTPSTVGTIVSLPAGSYTVTYEVTAFFYLEEETQPVEIFINSTGAHIDVLSLAPSRTEIGNNGLFSFWSTAMYFYYDRINGLRVKGATDIPGVLATGSVNSLGGTSNLWGAKKSSTNAGYTATGLYRVYHAVNSSAYTVNINCTTAGAIGTIVTKGTTYVDIQIYRNGANYQCGFDYTIYGAN